jgi:F0F1-type ATP synthase epsilon subunit
MESKSEQLLEVRFISPFETFFEGLASSVSAKDINGPFDILPGHVNFVGILTNSDVYIKSDKGDRSIGISKGIINVKNNKVEVFANV